MTKYTKRNAFCALRSAALASGPSSHERSTARAQHAILVGAHRAIFATLPFDFALLH